MKNKIFAILSFLILSTPLTARAENSVALSIVKPEQVDRCQLVKPGSLSIGIGEISWDSPDRSIGVTATKEGSQPVTLTTELEKILAESFKNFLGKCQFKVVDKSQAGIVLDIEIKDFFVKAENEIVVGKTKGLSNIVISYNNSKSGTYTVSSYGVEREYKTGPSKKLTRLEKVINQILVDTINDVASSRSFYDTIEMLSK